MKTFTALLLCVVGLVLDTIQALFSMAVCAIVVPIVIFKMAFGRK